MDISAPTDTGRGECSLCVLTNQFLKYMASSGKNTVDLKQAAIDLQTRKRRIYDVTNVLEGVGLIEKVGTNNVRWVPPDEASPLSTARFRRIHQQRLEQLDKLQQGMEKSIENLQHCIESLTSAAMEDDLLFVRQQDIASLDSLQGQQMMAIKAPPGSELTIPDPYRGIQQGQAGSGRFRAFVKSTTGPLAVWLVAGGIDKSAAAAHQKHATAAGKQVHGLPHNASAAGADGATEGMRTRNRTGAVAARRSYQDEDDLDGSPAAAPIDTLGPATPYPTIGTKRLHDDTPHPGLHS